MAKKFIFVFLTTIILVGCQSKFVTGETVTVAGSSYKNITTVELSALLKQKDFVFINVHIPFAGNIADTDLSNPYSQIDTPEKLSQLPVDKNAKIILYCRSERMSEIAAENLVSLGYANIWNLKDGIVD